MDANSLWSKMRKAGLTGPEGTKLPSKVPPVFIVENDLELEEAMKGIDHVGAIHFRGEHLRCPYPRFYVMKTNTVMPVAYLVELGDRRLSFKVWLPGAYGMGGTLVGESTFTQAEDGGWDPTSGKWLGFYAERNGFWGLDVPALLGLRGVFCSVAGLIEVINAPTNHVVRIDPKDARWKSDRTPPLEKLPRHILLQRKEVEKRWKTSHTSTGKTVMPHFRRGHWRVLRDEMYKQRQGEKVWVRPTKVGEPDVEWFESGQRYTVIA